MCKTLPHRDIKKHSLAYLILLKKTFTSLLIENLSHVGKAFFPAYEGFV